MPSPSTAKTKFSFQYVDLSPDGSKMFILEMESRLNLIPTKHLELGKSYSVRLSNAFRK